MKSTDAVIYAGDLAPALVIVLDGDDPVDATGVKTRLIGTRGGVIVIDEVLSDKSYADGATTVTYQWQPGDTDTVGPIQFEVEVEWPGALLQTFKACNTLFVKRDADHL